MSYPLGVLARRLEKRLEGERDAPETTEMEAEAAA
jgi:hypothetical protein